MMRTVLMVGILLVGQAFVLGPTEVRRRPLTLMSAEATVDYASMTVEKLEEELRATHNAVFAMRLEQMQSKRKEFKSSELRKLKKKIAQIMPYLEEKTAIASEIEEEEQQQ